MLQRVRGAGGGRDPRPLPRHTWVLQGNTAPWQGAEAAGRWDPHRLSSSSVLQGSWGAVSSVLSCKPGARARNRGRVFAKQLKVPPFVAGRGWCVPGLGISSLLVSQLIKGSSVQMLTLHHRPRPLRLWGLLLGLPQPCSVDPILPVHLLGSSWGG